MAWPDTLHLRIETSSAETIWNMSIYTTTVDTSTLALHLEDPGWIVVDCRFRLNDPAAGENLYNQSCIPGARYAHLDRDLAGPITPSSGRHPLPSRADFADTLGEWGISSSSQVVAYDDTGGAIAARLWWLLRWIGHYGTAVLDGGIDAWLGEGRAVVYGRPEVQRQVYFPVPMHDLAIDTAAVTALLDRPDMRLVDARAAERFRGEREPIDPVAGHIPGAVNRPFDRNLDANGRFLCSDALRHEWLELLAGCAPDRVVHMCGSGVTGCQNLLAMEVAGLEGSRLYPGSWSEWIRDERRPIALGE